MDYFLHVFDTVLLMFHQRICIWKTLRTQVDVRIVVLGFFVFVFFISLLSTENFWNHEFERRGEQKTTHITHALPK